MARFCSLLCFTDCYIVAGGLITRDEEGFAVVNTGNDESASRHALSMYRFAQAVLRVVSLDCSQHTDKAIHAHALQLAMRPPSMHG